MPRLPNLFQGPQKTKSAHRLYDIFLARLIVAECSDRVVTACREIRRLATAAGKQRAVAFTYRWEMEAHGQMRNFEAMWRTLRVFEQVSTGKKLRLASHQWTHKEQQQLIFSYAPLLFLRGRYRLGCRLMETALEMASHRKGWSFEWLWHVYKPVKTPSSRYDVTLAHFYAALNRDLSEWGLWDRFLDDFDPKLFRASGIARESIRENPRLIKPFFLWIVAERRNRLFTGTADGQRDLVETPSRVRRRQLTRRQMLLTFDERLDSFDQKLQTLFPELEDLPALPTFGQLLASRTSK